MGLEVLTGLVEDPKRPNNYIDGDILESKTAKTYKGKARLSPDGKRFFMRGHVGFLLCALQWYGLARIVRHPSSLFLNM